MRPILLLLLLGACSSATREAERPVSSPALRPLEAELREVVRRHAGDTAEIAVSLRLLGTGDSLLLGAHTPMHAASTMKVPVMLELFRRAEAGELSLDELVQVRNDFRSVADGTWYALAPEDDSDAELHSRIGERLPVRELVRRMIARSSNLATNLLVELAGPGRIATTLQEMGAGGMKVLRGVEDGPAFRRGLNNTTTAYGFMKTLEGLAAGRGFSAAAREEMLGILEAQEFREMIPAGVPPGVRVGNKTGWITGIQHDGAIVFPPGRGPYVLVVLTRGILDPEAAAEAVREISRAVWTSATEEGG